MSLILLPLKKYPQLSPFKRFILPLILYGKNSNSIWVECSLDDRNPVNLLIRVPTGSLERGENPAGSRSAGLVTHRVHESPFGTPCRVDIDIVENPAALRTRIPFGSPSRVEVVGVEEWNMSASGRR